MRISKGQTYPTRRRLRLFAARTRNPFTQSQQLPNHTNHRPQATSTTLINMKSPLSIYDLKAILLIAPLALGLYLCTVAVVQAGGKDPLYPGAVRPSLDYRPELSQGYLTVYS